MKQFLSILPLLLVFASALAQTGTDTRTPEKKEQDRQEAAAFEKAYPQLFRLNRMPVVLMDSSVVVDGFTSGLHVQNNYVVDSVHTNFHPNMPDTSTVTPLSFVKVAGPRVTLSYSNNHFLSIWGNASITPADSTGMAPNQTPSGNKKTRYVRIFLNGKLLIDWKPLDDFPKTWCKFYQEVPGPKSAKPIGTYMYDFDYHLCDTTLAVNGQLLVEIKIEPSNWMTDRYIISRSPSSPEVKATFSYSGASGNIATEETGGPSLEKKTLFGPTNRD